MNPMMFNVDPTMQLLQRYGLMGGMNSGMMGPNPPMMGIRPGDMRPGLPIQRQGNVDPTKLGIMNRGPGPIKPGLGGPFDVGPRQPMIRGDANPMMGGPPMPVQTQSGIPQRGGMLQNYNRKKMATPGAARY